MKRNCYWVEREQKSVVREGPFRKKSVMSVCMESSRNQALINSLNCFWENHFSGLIKKEP